MILVARLGYSDRDGVGPAVGVGDSDSDGGEGVREASTAAGRGLSDGLTRADSDHDPSLLLRSVVTRLRLGL